MIPMLGRVALATLFATALCAGPHTESTAPHGPPPSTDSGNDSTLYGKLGANSIDEPPIIESAGPRRAEIAEIGLTRSLAAIKGELIAPTLERADAPFLLMLGIGIGSIALFGRVNRRARGISFQQERAKQERLQRMHSRKAASR